LRQNDTVPAVLEYMTAAGFHQLPSLQNVSAVVESAGSKGQVCLPTDGLTEPLVGIQLDSSLNPVRSTLEM